MSRHWLVEKQEWSKEMKMQSTGSVKCLRNRKQGIEAGSEWEGSMVEMWNDDNVDSIDALPRFLGSRLPFCASSQCAFASRRQHMWSFPGDCPGATGAHSAHMRTDQSIGEFTLPANPHAPWGPSLLNNWQKGMWKANSVARSQENSAVYLTFQSSPEGLGWTHPLLDFTWDHTLTGLSLSFADFITLSYLSPVHLSLINYLHTGCASQKPNVRHIWLKKPNHDDPCKLFADVWTLSESDKKSWESFKSHERPRTARILVFWALYSLGWQLSLLFLCLWIKI